MAIQKPKLVDDWSNAPKWLSVQISLAAVIFSTLPTETQTAILSLIGIDALHMPGIIGAMVIVGRLVGQQKDGEA
jgi:hypothetical protein